MTIYEKNLLDYILKIYSNALKENDFHYINVMLDYDARSVFKNILVENGYNIYPALTVAEKSDIYQIIREVERNRRYSVIMDLDSIVAKLPEEFKMLTDFDIIKLCQDCNIDIYFRDSDSYKFFGNYESALLDGDFMTDSEFEKEMAQVHQYPTIYFNNDAQAVDKSGNILPERGY